MKQKFLSAITILLFFFFTTLLLATESDNTADLNNPIPSYSSDKTGLDVGGLFGIPSGFIMRYWFTNLLGMQAITGLSLDSDPLIGVDLLYQPFGMFHAATWNLYLTVGTGFMVSYIEKETEYIARIPVGITMPLDNYPVLFTLYGAPALKINNPVKKEFQWGIAVTYSFSHGEHLYGKRQQTENRNTYLKDEVQGLQSGLSETKGRLSKTESDLEKTRSKLSDTENELNGIRNELGVTKNEISRLQNSLSSTKGELETALTSLDEVKLRLDGAKDELNRTQQKLNEKDRELQQNQTDLNKAKEIIKTAFEGAEREEEEKKIKEKQTQLDREVKRLSEEKLSLSKGNEQESKARSLWKEKCTAKRGVINSDGECVCRVGETWNAKKNACVCIKGYSLNNKTDRCEPCEIINLNGSCVSGCNEDEKKTSMKDGPGQFVCIKKCRGKNEVWLKNSKKCACDEGYIYDGTDKCVPRR